MTTNRITRVNELIKREIAGAMYRVMDPTEVDMATITVTRVATSPDLRQARVYLSVRGNSDTKRDAFRKVCKHRKEFQQIVAENIVLKYNPQLRFSMDESIQQGDRVLEIISELGPLEQDMNDEEIHESNGS